MNILKAIIVMIIICAPLQAHAMGKITIDPNAPGVQKEASAQTTDTRLLKKVTYDSGYKRLHAVASDLTKMTGVSIVSGNGKTDWHVRDIPVVICVKDMPLGKLLRAIADATHTRVALDRIGDDLEKCYRIYRRSKEEKEINNILENEHKIRLEKMNWQWDAMVAYGKTDKELPGVPRETKLLAKLIASLGSNAKDKLFNGDTFHFSGKDVTTKQVMDELYISAWEENKQIMGEYTKTVAPLTSEDINASSLIIKLCDEGNTGNTTVQLQIPLKYSLNNNNVGSIWSRTLDIAVDLPDKGLNMSPYPTLQLQSDEADMNNPDMQLQKFSDWTDPLLNKKFDLEKPKDMKEVTFADVVSQIASKSGCNIVAEDFISHLSSGYQSIDRLLKKDTCIADCFRTFSFVCIQAYSSPTWFFDKASNLIVGNIKSWRNYHSNMLSEEFLNGLKSKLDGPGVELDDVTCFSNMQFDSFVEWIRNSRDFELLSQVNFSETAFWRVYDSLKLSDKQLAKSKDGLPFAKLDTAWLVDLFRTQKLKDNITINWIMKTSDEKQKEIAEHTLKEYAMSDPQVISSMVMHINKSPDIYQKAFRSSDGRTYLSEIPSAIKLNTYKMTINYKIDGEDYKIISGDLNYILFPIYSSKREAEIIKAAATEKER